MKRLLIMILCALPICEPARAQQYFKFIYTNTPVVYGADPYSVHDAMGWLYQGRIREDVRCTDCSFPAEDARIKSINMDSLHSEYLKIYPEEIIRKNYAPYVAHHVKEKQNIPYKIYTLYTVKGNNLVPLFQVKAIFAASIHNGKHDISDITFAKGDGIKKIDKLTVMTAYRAKLKEEAMETPPAVQELK